MVAYNATISFAGSNKRKISKTMTKRETSKKLKVGDKNLAHAQIRHSLRSEYDDNNHGNPNIDPSRTSDNILLVGGANGLHLADVDAIAEAEAYYAFQIEQATQAYEKNTGRAMRKDAVAGRYGTIQIDPAYWVEGAADVDEFFTHAVGYLKAEFDERNIVFAALHMDETSHHVQFMLTLRDYEDDGAFRQRKWFSGEASYGRINTRLRRHYQAHSKIPMNQTRKKVHDGLEPNEHLNLVLDAIEEAQRMEYEAELEAQRIEAEAEAEAQLTEFEARRSLDDAAKAREEARRDREQAERDRKDARLEKESAVALSDKALERLTHINQITDTLENLHAKMKLPPERKTQGARIVSNARKVAASYKQEIEAEGGELAL